MPADLRWPDPLSKDRGPGYWLRPGNLIEGRRRLRTDHSNEWRYEFLRTSSPPPPPPGCDPDPGARSRSFSWLLKDLPARQARPAGAGFRCVILGDTGEGDYSQYALLPIIRSLAPDFVIVNGDVAYPAGKSSDYTDGFFRPYRGLGIPVWAVPGNHDYYSSSRGREFHEIFCTDLRRREWDEAGLISKPQPGSYWELAEPDGSIPLVILGIDSGHSADLDGKHGGGFLGIFGKPQGPDTQQHQWLEWRLSRAQQAGSKVIVLYHIPALVAEKHVGKVNLTVLHRILAQYPCVSLVITAHEHNYQRYDPAVFGRYLAREYHTAPPAAPPTYLVSGAGGAYITATDFDNGKKTGYVTTSRFPDAKDWKEWAPTGLKLVASARRGNNIFNNIAIGLTKVVTSLAERSDADRPQRLSFLLLDYASPALGATVQAYFVRDLGDMYGHLPPNTPVRVQEGVPACDPAAVLACATDPPIRI
jgi:3',5'-cyclic AMP phosphodiesterase CpdA